MDIQTLDAIFLLFFSQLMPGEVISLDRIHSEYDYRNKGILSKEELEYVINRQISINKLKPLSITQFEVGEYTGMAEKYQITNHEFEKSVKAYYATRNFTPQPHPLWKK
jgi:hypothetical protein